MIDVDIAADTGGARSSEPEGAAPTYDVYLSYSADDKARVRIVAKQLETIGKRYFDEDELVAGKSELGQREVAMRTSTSIAVFAGPTGFSQLTTEEAKQALRRAIDKGNRAFLVYLPGFQPDQYPFPAGLAGLIERVPVDLRQQFDDEGSTREGLAGLISGVDGITPAEAAEWLDVHRPVVARAPRLRAMVVAVRDYDHYDELPAADDDRDAVTELLLRRPVADGGEVNWEIVVTEYASKAELTDATKDFFLSDVEADDTLLFYFSGHGDLQGDLPYLCVKESEPRFLDDTAFSIRQRLANYVALSQSRRKLIILDCCFAGEAADDNTAWGQGAAVIMAPRQWVQATGGMSELTDAVTAAWGPDVRSTGDLLDALQATDMRINRTFDRTSPLPPAAPRPRPTPPSARLVFDKHGGLSIKLSDGKTESTASDLAGWRDGRGHLVDNLIELVDAVVSLVPPDQIPIASVKAALTALGSDLLLSMLTDQVRADLGGLDTWDEVRLELSFDENWEQRDSWERVPWECLSLCRDNKRPVALERLIRAKSTKSALRPSPPRRVVAWSSFAEADPTYPDGSKHLLTHLLREGVRDIHPGILVKEDATWIELSDASRLKRLPTDGDTFEPITDFDTMVLLVPVTLGGDSPEVWLRGGSALKPVPAMTLVNSLQNWTCSYVILETIAGQPRLGAREDTLTTHARSLQATTQLATKLARELNASVVAACHSPQFIELARPAEDAGGIPPLSFAAALLRQLADPSKSLYDAAQAARNDVDNQLVLDGALHLGLPIVCRPEPRGPTARRTAGTLALPRLDKTSAGNT